MNLTIGDKGEPDHFPLLLDVPLKVFWPEGKISIKADSEEEADFLGEVIISLGQIPIPDIMSADQTQAVAQAISKVFDSAWTHHTRTKWACARSKSWWDVDCNRAKASVMTSDLPADWMAFKRATRKAKRKHFDERIDKIAHTKLRPWDLMDWVGPPKTPPVEAILYQGVPCTSPDQLWNTLHSTFNSALDRPIDLSVLGNKWDLILNTTLHCQSLPFNHFPPCPRDPPLLGRGYHILLRRCRMPSWACRTDLPPGRITSCGIILSVSSETDTRAAYSYGWQTPVCSLATGLLNSRPLLQWLYQNQVNHCMTLPSHFAQLFF
jgi:hypothetical protein